MYFVIAGYCTLIALVIQFDGSYSGSTSNTSALWWLLRVSLKPICADNGIRLAGVAALLPFCCNWALTYADIGDLRYIIVFRMFSI